MPERKAVGVEDLCAMSDLPPAQCWHCRPAVPEPEALEPEPHTGGWWFDRPRVETRDPRVDYRYESHPLMVTSRNVRQRFGAAPDTVLDDDWATA